MNPQKTIVCFGAGPAFKGGMSNYNTSLAKAFDRLPDVRVHVVSWLHQYPSIVPREFRDKVSQLDFLEGSDISIKYLLNYNNPLSWYKTARYIADLQPDQVIIQWSIAIQGLPLGQMVRTLKRLSDCEVIFDMHFVIQKERSRIDALLTQWGIARADTFVVHALETWRELQQVYPQRAFYLSEDGERGDGTATPVVKLFHPIYDLYQPDPDFDVAAFRAQHGLRENVFLFFGFIRKYKGLHHAIEAFRIVADQRDDVSFMICGELFWDTLPDGWAARTKRALFGAAKRLFLNAAESEQAYNPLPMVEKLGLSDRTMIVSEFIPNEDVHKYFQAANAVVLFYSRATPSGIESLSYNFNVPILATRVGHFPETIQEGKNGYMVAENTVESMAQTMLRSLEDPIPPANVDAFKDNLSWERYARAILRGVR